LYGLENWFLILKKEYRMRVFESRILRGIFRRKRDEIVGGWRKLFHEELHSLYSSPNVIRIIKPRRMT
jgi:hypothetical protein